MSDIPDRAEALAERYNSSGFIHKEATLLLPDLIAKIKQQAAYVARLEAAYLIAEQARIYEASKRFGMHYTEGEILVHARESLEQIKRGGQG